MNPIQFFQAAAGGPGGTVLDIGAFMGEHASAFSQIVGPGGKVFAFEAQPFHFAQLSANLAQLPHHNAFAIARAVGDHNGFVTLNVDMTQTAQASTIIDDMAVSERLGSNFIRLRVESETVDHFCEQKKVQPSFLKIDVEGAESSVVRGAMQTIRTALPGMYLETTVHCHQQSIPSFPFMLEELGYRLFLVDVLWHRDRWVNQEPAYQSQQLHPFSADQCLEVGPVIMNLAAIHRSKLAREHPLISTRTGPAFFADAPRSDSAVAVTGEGPA
jgi:FkbM family methyltransferase